jgi:hypothetical protein
MSVASKNERTAMVKVTRPPARRLGPMQGTDRLMTMAVRKEDNWSLEG